MKHIFSLALATAVSLSLLASCTPAAPASSSEPAGSVSCSTSSAPDQSLPQETETPSSGELKLSKFKNIELSTLSPNIRIERGEGWAVRYALHTKEKVTRAEVEGDTFYFSSAFQPEPTVDVKECELVIIIPVGADLEDVELSTAAGSIELFNLTCGNLELETVSGDIKLDHVISRSLEMESTSGNITTVSCTAETAEAESTSGPVRLDGTYQKAELSSVSGTCELCAQIDRAADIETVSGNVTVQAPLQKLELETIGAIVVNGKRQNGKSFSSGEGEPSLSVKSVSGKVSVDQNVLVMIQ